MKFHTDIKLNPSPNRFTAVIMYITPPFVGDFVRSLIISFMNKEYLREVRDGKDK